MFRLSSKFRRILMKRCREMQLKHFLSFLACSSKVQDPISSNIIGKLSIRIGCKCSKGTFLLGRYIESQVTRIQVTTIPVSWKSWHFPSVCCLEVSVFDFSGVKIAPTTSIHRRNCIVLSLRYLLTVSRISQFPRNFWPESVCPFPGEKHMGRNDAIQYRVAKLRTRHGWGFEPYKDCPFAATWCVLWFWGMLGMMTMADYGDMHLDDEQVFCWGQ